jgi:hypothetical protein
MDHSLFHRRVATYPVGGRSFLPLDPVPIAVTRYRSDDDGDRAWRFRGGDTRYGA